MRCEFIGAVIVVSCVCCAEVSDPEWWLAHTKCYLTHWEKDGWKSTRECLFVKHKGLFVWKHEAMYFFLFPNRCQVKSVISSLFPGHEGGQTFSAHSPICHSVVVKTLIARFMRPTWGPSGANRTQVGPMLAPWTIWGVLFVFTTLCRCFPYLLHHIVVGKHQINDLINVSVIIPTT